MKDILHKACAFLTALLLSFNFVIPVYGEDRTIIFNGNDQGFDMGEGSEYTETDLFDNFKNVMPGDSLEQVITVENHAEDSGYIDLYLRVEVHDQDGRPVSEDESLETMLDFLSQLNMKIYQGDRVIYESSTDDPAQLTENTFLLRISKNRSAKLRVDIDVPIELGNEYMNRTGAIDWIFTAEGKDRPQTPITPDKPSGDDTPSKPSRPQTPVTNDRKSPFTGDSTNLILYAGIGFLAIGFACIILSEKKKRS